MLSPEEIEILEYLKPFHKEFLSAKEICRRAGGKMKFTKNPDWAKPILRRMENAGLLEMDAYGHYRIKPPERDAKKGRTFPVSPQIQKILARSDKSFGKIFILEDDPGSTPSQSRPPGKTKKSK
jgi:hypothetical protein